MQKLREPSLVHLFLLSKPAAGRNIALHAVPAYRACTYLSLQLTNVFDYVVHSYACVNNIHARMCVCVCVCVVFIRFVCASVRV